jgi:hypothetical protein
MTIFGTPAGTPLNYTGFQGTQPGNPVQNTLQPTIPGVGLFPPNSNNLSGDTSLAAMSRGSAPANVNVGGFGTPGSGNKPLNSMSGAGERGTGWAFVANGGSQNDGPSGAGNGNAGGVGQVTGAVGEASIIPANVPSSVPTISSPPSYRG